MKSFLNNKQFSTNTFLKMIKTRILTNRTKMLNMRFSTKRVMGFMASSLVVLICFVFLFSQPKFDEPSWESYVISFEEKDVDAFEDRNQNNGIDLIQWFPALDGYEQRTLNEFASLTNTIALDATHFNKTDPRMRKIDPRAYDIGCFMSHYELLHSAWKRWNLPSDKKPDALFVFEDDASCIKHTVRRSRAIVDALPEDWDILYLGGKPFVQHDFPSNSLLPRNVTSLLKLSEKTFHRWACDEHFGNKTHGLLAQDEARSLSRDELYWSTGYILNMHSYVVNANRIERILSLMTEEVRYHFAVDIVLAGIIESGKLKAFIPTEIFCVQQKEYSKKGSNSPWKPLHSVNWGVFHYHKATESARWTDLFLPECPNKP